MCNMRYDLVSTWPKKTLTGVEFCPCRAVYMHSYNDIFPTHNKQAHKHTHAHNTHMHTTHTDNTHRNKIQKPEWEEKNTVFSFGAPPPTVQRAPTINLNGPTMPYVCTHIMPSSQSACRNNSKYVPSMLLSAILKSPFPIPSSN